MDEILADHWAWVYAENPKAAENEVIDDEFDPDDALAGIDGDGPVDDAAAVCDVDDWEDVK